MREQTPEVRLRCSDEIFEGSRIVEHRGWDQPNDAVRETGIEIQYSAIGDIRSDCDAKRSRRPLEALRKAKIVVFVRVGVDQAPWIEPRRRFGSSDARRRRTSAGSPCGRCFDFLAERAQFREACPRPASGKIERRLTSVSSGSGSRRFPFLALNQLRLLFAIRFKQFRRRFVVRVLRHELAADGEVEDGLAELLDLVGARW